MSVYPASLPSAPESRVAPRWRVIGCAAPRLPVETVFAHCGEPDSVFWAPPAGPAAVAWGVLERVSTAGRERMPDLKQAGAALLAEVDASAISAQPAPRLWGGLAFAPGAADADCWSGFGDANFILPRCTYWQDGEAAWLQVIVPVASAHAEAELASELARLASLATLPAPRPPQGVSAEILPPDPAAWHRQIAAILSAISAGRARKVVSAHASEVRFEHAPQAAAVLCALAAEGTSVWRYAMARGGATLLGATPERLVRLEGLAVTSEALAGTLAKSAGTAADLLASIKDRREHELVCQGVREALGPFCARLEVPATPQIRELCRLYHLATPVSGRLATPRHVMDLVYDLHPTPATGGTPRDVAFEIIATTETTPRGWYAAPVGWFDADGNGEFVVALRSGLIRDKRAWVFAGAGIVAGSQAEAELAETELKQRVMLNALGASLD